MPYRTPGREVTEEDRRAAEERERPAVRDPPKTGWLEEVLRPVNKVTIKHRERAMVEQMIKAHKEARRRSHGKRQWMRYRLSVAAMLEYEQAMVDGSHTSMIASAMQVVQGEVPTPKGCSYAGTFCGQPVFVDPTTIAGWTVEVG